MQTHSGIEFFFSPYIDEGADVLQVVLVHLCVGRCQVQKVVVTSLGTFELGLLHSAMSLSTHTDEKKKQL